MKSHNESDHRMFLKLFRSYALMVFVPILVLSIVVIYGILEKVERDINSLNETIFNQCQNSLDDNLRSINSIMYHLTEDNDVIEFVSEKHSDVAVKNYVASKVMKKIRGTRAVNSIFSTIAIYSHENDAVVSESELYSTERFFSQMGEKAEEWITDSKSSLCKQYENSLVYSHRLLGSPDEYDRIIINIKLSDIFKMFDVLEVNGAWCFAVTDKAGNVLVNSNPAIPLEKLPDFDGKRGTFKLKVGGENFKGTYSFSGVDNLVYACLISKNGMSGNTNKMIFTFVLIVFVCLGGCLLFAFHNTRKSYAPLKETMDVNKTLSQNIEQMSGVIKKSVLINLLRGIYSDDEKEGLLETYKKRLSGPMITVAAVGATDLSKRTSLIASAEALDRCLEEEGIAFERVKTDGEHNIYIISHEKSDIELLLKSTMETLSLQKCEGMNISLGESVSDLLEVHISYDTALFALNSAFRKGLDMKVVKYDTKIGGDGIDFSADKKTAIVECVKTGDTDKVEKLLSGIYQTNFIDRQLEHNLLSGLINRLSATLLEILDGFFVKNTEKQRAYVNICKQASVDKNVFGSFDLLKSAFLDLTAQMKNYQMEKSATRIDEILEFIHSNYSNSDMSLGLVADRFYINYQYLSKLFVAKTGKYFVDYLSLYRLEKSKELLSKTQLKVEDIAKKVGFTSGNSYIRTFKKHYEITPGQYKKNLENMHQE